MKKIKKLLALAMAMCMIFSMSTVAFATDGTIDNPHIYQYRGAAVEITVPAQSRVYYEISATLATYIESGVIMEVTGDNNVVVYYGVRGQGMMPGQTAIEIQLDSSLMTFSLENASESDITVYVDLVESQSSGTMNNPFVLDEAGFVEAEIAEGNQEGYWISYVAPADGILGVEVWANDADYNDLGWQFFVNNESAGKYGDIHASDDEEVVSYEEIEVSAGDMITIMANTYEAPADQYSWPGVPAGIVNVYVTFTAPEGTVGNPKWFDDVVSDVIIPAGTKVYYQGKFGGTTLVIEDADAYVIFNGDTYEAVDGVVSIDIPVSEGGMWAPADIFVIGNNGSSEATFTVEFVYPEGDSNNPADLVIGDDNEADIEAGNSQGYYFTWIATGDGELTISVSGETGWEYVVNNITTYAYGDKHWSDDDPLVSSVTIEVAEGDEIQIIVNTYDPDNMFSTPAGTVNVTAAFESGEEEVPPTEVPPTEVPPTEVPPTEAPKTADMAPIAMIIAIAAVAAVVVLKKRTVVE